MKAKPAATDETDPFAKMEFEAYFPAIGSAIKVGQDGMRITLDIPENQMAKALGLISLREKVLKVTIEEAE